MDKNLLDFVVSTLIATAILVFALYFDTLRTLLLYTALIFAALAFYNIFAYVQKQKRIEKEREIREQLFSGEQQ